MPVLFIIIVGAAAGLIATRLLDFRTGLFQTILIGMAGAFIGGLILRFLLLLTGAFAGFVGAILGAILLIWIWKQLSGRDKK